MKYHDIIVIFKDIGQYIENIRIFIPIPHGSHGPIWVWLVIYIIYPQYTPPIEWAYLGYQGQYIELYISTGAMGIRMRFGK